MLVSTDCANAMASRLQPATKSSRPTAPINLRMRMDIALKARLREHAPVYRVRAILRKHTVMDAGTTVPNSHARALRLWLLAVAAMIFLTLVVGGETRLTESGLSITEWKPVSGVLPPLSQQAWQDEFKAYQAIPQYQERNRGMSLAAFKTIYWWEWTHRLLARSTGFVFLLAFHLALACAIYAAVLWTAQQIAPRPPTEAPQRLRLGALTIAALVLGQIYLGALVAGIGAGLVYNTWPLIDGAFVPASDRLWFFTPLWRNLFENTLTVQFDHRMLAYAIWLAAIWHAWNAWRIGRDLRGALVVAGAVTLQAALGIVTLVHQAALPLALAHQMVAIVVFTAAILHAERLWHRESL